MRYKIVLLIFTFFLGCGRTREKQQYFAGKDPVDTFNQKTQQDVFVQETNVTISKPSSIDMLFVVDNSESMSEEQEDLADNFDIFIDKFLELNIDFKIGIITTDADANANTDFSLWTPQKRPDNWEKIKRAHLHHTSTLHCKINVVQDDELTSTAAEADEAEFKKIFQESIKVGLYGSGKEKPIFCIKSFLDYNPEWVRTDSSLSIIIVSDEDEHPTTQNTDIAGYLKTLKTNNDFVKIFSIIDLYCADDKGKKYSDDPNKLYEIIDKNIFCHKDTETKKGIRENKNFSRTHIKAAMDTGGSFYSITSPFDSILKKIKETTTEIAIHFKIKRVLSPEELKHIRIEVDGFAVDDNMWTFHQDKSSFTFNKEYPLNPESEVVIVFAEIVSEFRLSKKLNSKHINTVNITVDGNLIPQEHWEYKAERNSIRFKSGHLPPEGSSISVSYTDIW